VTRPRTTVAATQYDCAGRASPSEMVEWVRRANLASRRGRETRDSGCCAPNASRTDAVEEPKASHVAIIGDDGETVTVVWSDGESCWIDESPK
jgi:hypothetical protein